ncbi:MAG TPA: hypothetical protein VF461_21955 [Gemmatimonadaceae bacterium]
MRRLSFVVLALTLVPLVGAHAQRSRMGDSLGVPTGVGDQRRPSGPSSAEAERQMRDRASLGDAVKKIPDFTDAQKDSVKALEKRYGELFRSYASALRTQMDRARSPGGQPDLRTMGMLRLSADSAREAEIKAARAVLTSDTQRAKFDQNLLEMSEREARREEDMRRRRALADAPSTLGGDLNNGAMPGGTNPGGRP